MPILPRGFLFFLAVRLALGAREILPVFAFVASFIVQTHVGYVPAVLALCVVPLANHVWRPQAAKQSRVRSPRELWSVAATIGVLLVTWSPPMCEMAVNPPGNLLRVISFFRWKLPSQSWVAALRTVAEQMAIMPCV